MTWSAEDERLIWETEQGMLPVEERDCTGCRGKKIRYEDHGWYHVLVGCSDCKGQGTYFAQRANQISSNTYVAAATALGREIAKAYARDLEAVMGDFRKVGQDMRSAFTSGSALQVQQQEQERRLRARRRDPFFLDFRFSNASFIPKR